MKDIPTRRINDIFDGNFAFLLRNSKINTDKDIKYGHVENPHRDEYYIFLLIKDGKGKALIDFEEHQFEPGTLHFILPGQVHRAAGDVEIDCWFLAVDSLLIKDEYKDIFEKQSLYGISTHPATEQIKQLESLLMLIEERLLTCRNAIDRNILADLISSYIGMVAEIYQEVTTTHLNKRHVEITLIFKSLLSQHYSYMKRPCQYAAKMNLSQVYLNEAVKKTTGLSVSECIRNEVILQAKRLLYYTNMPVKDISLKLGYEDWAYFTRLFSNATGTPPSLFRKNIDLSNKNIF